jgi:hypothetical protein
VHLRGSEGPKMLRLFLAILAVLNYFRKKNHNIRDFLRILFHSLRNMIFSRKGRGVGVSLFWAKG